MEEIHFRAYVLPSSTLHYAPYADRPVVVDISDSVEYKSLPSGLHTVQEDTVYVSVSTPGQ